MKAIHTFTVICTKKSEDGELKQKRKTNARLQPIAHNKQSKRKQKLDTNTEIDTYHDAWWTAFRSRTSIRDPKLNGRLSAGGACHVIQHFGHGFWTTQHNI